MLADGTVIDRSLQYMMVDKSTEDKSQWRGMSGFRRGHVFIPQAMEAAMGGSRARPAVMTVILALRSSAGRCADASDAQAKVDAAVVPAADVSRSIDDSEFVLERLATYSADP